MPLQYARKSTGGRHPQPYASTSRRRLSSSPSPHRDISPDPNDHPMTLHEFIGMTTHAFYAARMEHIMTTSEHPFASLSTTHAVLLGQQVHTLHEAYTAQFNNVRTAHNNLMENTDFPWRTRCLLHQYRNPTPLAQANPTPPPLPEPTPEQVSGPKEEPLSPTTTNIITHVLGAVRGTPLFPIDVDEDGTPWNPIIIL